MNEESSVHSLITQYENERAQGGVSFYDVEQFEQMANYFMDLGDWDSFKTCVEDARAQHPQSLTFRIKEIQWHIAVNEIDEAEDKILGLESLSGTHPELLIARASILMGKGEIEKAQDLLESALENADDPSEVYQMIVDAHQNNGDFRKAIDTLLRWIKSEDHIEDSALYQLGMCYDFTGLHHEAVQTMEQLTDAAPYNALVWYQLGNSHLKLDQVEEARQAYEYAVLAEDDFHPAHYELGRIAEKKLLLKEALAHYKNALSEDLPSGYIHLKIGLLELEFGAYELAESNLLKALDLDADPVDVNLAMANLCTEQERWEEAAKHYRYVWAEDAYHSEDVLDYVEVLLELDDLDLAIATLEFGMEKFPDLAEDPTLVEVIAQIRALRNIE